MKLKIFFIVVVGIILSTIMFKHLDGLKNMLIESENKKLLTVASSSAYHIEHYFLSLEKALYTMAGGLNATKALKAFEEAFGENNTSTIQSAYTTNNPFKANDRDMFVYALDVNFSYNMVHRTYHPYFQKERERYGIYDLFLINAQGDVVYSLKKKGDFAINLLQNPKNPLSIIYKKSANLTSSRVIYEDFQPDVFTKNRLNAFLAIPLFQKSRYIGTLAIEVPVSEIVDFKEGVEANTLGESGEAYIVGLDKVMLCSIHLNQNSNQLDFIKVDTQSVKEGLKGRSGYKLIKNYNEKEVYSIYYPIKVFHKKWVFILEISQYELIERIKTSMFLLFIMSLTILAFLILSIIFIVKQYFIRPLKNEHARLSESLKKQRSEALAAEILLDEYKRAVDASTIVSKSDRRGFITYVNDEFCKISGYTREELIGKPHNIVRHPDTPKTIFKDLWKTIQSKNIWEGIIQNLKKDGGSYYVKSTIIPMLDKNGEIKEFMSIRSDITELINQEKKIHKQTTDRLTHLPNRVKLFDDIESTQAPMKLAIIMINDINNIDNFYGKAYSDDLVKEVARKLQTLALMQQTKLYHIASGEFALLSCSDLSYSDFMHLCETIHQYFSFNNLTIFDDSFPIQLSIGTTSGEENLYINAERAIYIAQKMGKSIISYDNTLAFENNFEKNRQMVTKLKEAIHHDNIVVFAQPIIHNQQTGELKYECLVRMVDGERVVSPFFFLDIAKQAYLYTSITKIVIEKSFKYFSNKEASFSINLTIEDILTPEIVEFLKSSIIHYHVANKLTLEIVESEGIENFEDVSRFIKEMKAIGCKIAIDDFGTGYSNFEYLMRLDADFIKIDGSLIKNIDTDETSQVVVELIIDFAKKLDLRVIAEYVHNESVLQRVQDLGIDYSQGYYLGEPKALD